MISGIGMGVLKNIVSILLSCAWIRTPGVLAPVIYKR